MTTHRRIQISTFLAFVAVLALAAPPLGAQSPAPIESALKSAYAKYKDIKEGKNADYIPALAKVDPNIYGIALVTTDGKVYTAGDVKSEVSIQSISKVFTMAKVIGSRGRVHRQADRRRRYGDALQLHRRRRVREEGPRRAGDQPAGQPRRHHRHEHGQGNEPRRNLEEHPQLLLRVRGPSPLGQPGRLQVGIRQQPAQQAIGT
jgi:hypothetical protein